MVGLGTVAPARKVDSGNTLGDALVVVVEGDIAERTDGSSEELLIANADKYRANFRYQFEHLP